MILRSEYSATPSLFSIAEHEYNLVYPMLLGEIRLTLHHLSLGANDTSMNYSSYKTHYLSASIHGNFQIRNYSGISALYIEPNLSR